MIITIIIFKTSVAFPNCSHKKSVTMDICALIVLVIFGCLLYFVVCVCLSECIETGRIYSHHFLYFWFFNSSCSYERIRKNKHVIHSIWHCMRSTNQEVSSFCFLYITFHGHDLSHSHF